MPIDYFKLTEAQQKAYSKIRKDIQYQEGVIETEKQLKVEAPNTYIVDRANKSLSLYISRMEKLESDYKAKKEQIASDIAVAEECLRKEKERESRTSVIARMTIKRLEKEIDALGLPQVSTPPLTQHAAPPRREGGPSYEEFMSEGFDEEEVLRRSRARREQAPPEKKQEPVNYDSSESESEKMTEEECQKMDRYQAEQATSFPPTITNTKTKKPVKQILKR